LISCGTRCENHFCHESCNSLYNYRLVAQRYRLVAPTYRLVSQKWCLVAQKYPLVAQKYALVAQKYFLVGQKYALVAQKYFLVAQKCSLVAHKYRHQGHLGALLWPAGWYLEATWEDLEFFMMVIADVAEACGCFAEA